MFVRKKNPGGDRATEDNRRAPRVEICLEVAMDGDEEHGLYWGVTRDLAEGGLFISTFQTRPIGQELSLRLVVPRALVPELGGDPLPLKGVVVWVREHSPRNKDLPPGMGIKLLDPSPAAKQALRALVAQREPALYE